MADMNQVISRNIMELLTTSGKKPDELADHLGLSVQEMRIMLSGTRVINADQLHQIADYFSVSMEQLVKVPAHREETNVLRALINQEKSPEAREALEIADEIADLICFYARITDNAQEMKQSWEA